MKPNSPPPSDPQVFAILHFAGGEWRALAISTASRLPEIVGSRTFSRSETGRVDPWLDEYRVSRVFSILPAASVICRTLTLPDADQEQLNQALHLQAEALLLGIAPPHRVGLAVLPANAGETTRVGMVLAWPESCSIEPPPTDRPVSYAPDTAALAALINGNRPEKPLLWLDPDSQSLSLALSHAHGVVFRAAREGGGTAEDARGDISRTVAETALNVGHSASFVDQLVAEVRELIAPDGETGATLILPEEVRQQAGDRLRGAHPDESWWATYGLAAGAALAVLGPMSPLTGLVSFPPDLKPPLYRRISERLSQPRTAVAMALLAILVIILGPLLYQGARLTILKVLHTDLKERLDRAELVHKQYEMYQQLEQDAWPITKLLADIACNTPRGIEIDTIRITSQAGTFALGGTSLPQPDGRDAREVITEMRKNLDSSGLFDSPNARWGDRDNLTGKYHFEMTGRIRHPYRKVAYELRRDFAALTMQERIDGKSWKEGDTEGEEESSSALIAVATPSPTPRGIILDMEGSGRTTRENRRSSRRPGLSPSGGGESGDVGDPGTMTSRTEGSGRAVIVPEPITPDQIKNMTKAEARDMLQKIGEARQRGHFSEEIRERLQNEFKLLVTHITKLKSAEPDNRGGVR